MIKNIKQYFSERFFGEHLPFGYRLFMLFFMALLGVSIFSASTNTALGKGIWGLIFQWSFIAVLVVVAVMPVRVRMKVSKLLLVFTAFVYLPFLFFQAAGYDGTAGLFVIIVVFLFTFLFNGKTRVVLVGLNLILWIVICTINFMHPELIVPHAGEQAKFIDYVMAATLTMVVSAIIGSYYRNQFDKETMRIKLLNKELEENNKILEEITVRDALTNLYNRRNLTDRVNADIEKIEEGESLFLLVIDLDHFKKINDTYGHQVGDEVIVKFAEALRNSVREGDVLSRIGGEEFIAVLYGIDKNVAMEIAERIRKNVSEMTFSQELHVTTSIGVVPVRSGDNYDLVFSRADACMYQAKEQGRNRVVFGDA